MLTISLMFWTDSACFLVHMLADPYVRQHKCPSIRLLTWALDVSPVHCLLKGQRTFSTWYILLFKKSPLLKAHMCNGICFTLYLCRSCRSCIGLKTRESESSWVFGKGTFTSVFLLLVSGSTERNEGQDFDSSELIMLAVSVTDIAATFFLPTVVAWQSHDLLSPLSCSFFSFISVFLVNRNRN